MEFIAWRMSREVVGVRILRRVEAMEVWMVVWMPGFEVSMDMVSQGKGEVRGTFEATGFGTDEFALDAFA